jgi:hypothetical protein
MLFTETRVKCRTNLEVLSVVAMKITAFCDDAIQPDRYLAVLRRDML